MCDELLRHIQTHYGELRKTRYTDKNGKQQQLLTGQALGVLLSIAGHAHHRDFVCYAGQLTIADESGLSKQNVSKYVNLLIDAGWLIPDGTQPTGRASRPTHRYIVNLPGCPLPQPTQLPEAQSFTPNKVPTDTPAIAPTDAPTVAPTGRGRTEQNIKEHTTEKERVSREAQKELATGLKAFGSEYAQRQLRKSSTEIKNPGGYLRNVSKAVTSPEGEHYETACRLFVEHPGASPGELCDLLERSLTGGSTDSTGGRWSPGAGHFPSRPPDEIHTPDKAALYDIALSRYERNGYTAARAYLRDSVHLSDDEKEKLCSDLDRHALSESGLAQEAARLDEQNERVCQELEAAVGEPDELVQQLGREVIGRFTDSDT
jgi:hypothetical protein